MTGRKSEIVSEEDGRECKFCIGRLTYTSAMRKAGEEPICHGKQGELTIDTDNVDDEILFEKIPEENQEFSHRIYGLSIYSNHLQRTKKLLPLDVIGFVSMEIEEIGESLSEENSIMSKQDKSKAKKVEKIIEANDTIQDIFGNVAAIKDKAKENHAGSGAIQQNVQGGKPESEIIQDVLGNIGTISEERKNVLLGKRQKPVECSMCYGFLYYNSAMRAVKDPPKCFGIAKAKQLAEAPSFNSEKMDEFEKIFSDDFEMWCVGRSLVLSSPVGKYDLPFVPAKGSVLVRHDARNSKGKPSVYDRVDSKKFDFPDFQTALSKNTENISHTIDVVGRFWSRALDGFGERYVQSANRIISQMEKQAVAIPKYFVKIISDRFSSSDD